MNFIEAYCLICIYSGVFAYALAPELIEEIWNEEDLGYDPYCRAVYLRTCGECSARTVL